MHAAFYFYYDNKKYVVYMDQCVSRQQLHPGETKSSLQHYKKQYTLMVFL